MDRTSLIDSVRLSARARQGCAWRFALGLFAGVALLLAASIRPAAASVVLALSLEDLTRKSEVIVLGVPTEQQSRRHFDGKLIVTDVSVRVEDVLKGSAKRGQTVVATVLGGKLDGIALQVPGEAHLPIGQRLLLFLYRAPTSGDLRVVGMSQGVLALTQQGNTTMVTPGGTGAALVQPGSDGQLRDAPDALMQPQPLGDLLDRIRALVSTQSGK
jgi:hypothetical protein